MMMECFSAMTAEQILQNIYTHLSTMERQCNVGEGAAGLCRLRNEDMTEACLIGGAFPNSIYKPEMEKAGYAMALIVNYEETREFLLPDGVVIDTGPKDTLFKQWCTTLNSIQTAHDGCGPFTRKGHEFRESVRLGVLARIPESSECELIELARRVFSAPFVDSSGHKEVKAIEHDKPEANG